MSLATQVVWFKRDLRIADHAPLTAANAAGAILPLYIIEPDYWQLPDVSQRHWHFIHEPWLMMQPPADYPAPIVDHEVVAPFAREEISKRWHGEGFKKVAKEVSTKLGSRRKKKPAKAKKTKETKHSGQLDFDI